ncbi:hypothetical protein T552_01512 [Pneumocystis carinii B80]|uniref:Myosin-2 n=1 Tax=Pneumocystis carinii (strain B80) TaxID=1408658 RepID=A0A0W4ZKI2_PNEC8|nr:hypothetical protein T552_01512 [Pneumocystis carinii B80]KTW28883.1 hypothetical protein T552_01512 [Pneumocystis carinii B80]
MRYSQLQIYTYSGIVLIAVNPFQNIALYSNDIIRTYSKKNKGELEPHIFAIAEDSYRCMIRDNINQTIVVSGESGAGKTVSAKYIMRYFATVEDPERSLNRELKNIKSEMSETEERILATNPVIEAFGNAKTIRNDNSSRFGKYIEINFDNNAEIVGARIRTYLLERSRIVFQPKNERNYHIFYQLCFGATENEKEEFGLKDPSDFHYLNQGESSTIPGINDLNDFIMTRNALKTMGITDEVQNDIFKVLAALLHLGNVKIQALRNNALLSASDATVEFVCKLLGIDNVQFAKWIVKKQINTRNEKIITDLNQKQAIVVRDSVSKFLYSSLFDWLINSINCILKTKDEIKTKTFIGVLDIYGFEHFDINSFEQFCINYANEKLQQEFTQHVFKLEQEEYIREKINWTFIDFSDNQPCIDLIESRLGILSLLDEESRLPAGSDESFVTKLVKNFTIPTYQNYFRKARFGMSSFTICHYALEVTYQSDGFIEKNKDTISDDLLNLLNSTTNNFVKEIILSSLAFQEKNQYGSQNNTSKPVNSLLKKPTLGSIFKSSLIGLMDTINSTNVHYIRCIKPNDEKVSWKFEPKLVLSQLRACGVLETIRISSAGFPGRWTFQEFISRYYILVHSSFWNNEAKKLSIEILEKTVDDSNKYQIGLTKIFFRAGMLAYFEHLRLNRLNECAILIQKNMLSYMYRKRYIRIRKSIILLQNYARGFSIRKKAYEMKCNLAALKLQTAWRRYYSQNLYRKTRNAIILLQSVVRCYLIKKKVLALRKEKTATKIQSLWKRYIARKKYKIQYKRIVCIQSCWRRKKAKDELKRLRIEAKSLSHFKEVSYKLENKVIELTHNLSKKHQENKLLLAQIEDLENLNNTWKTKSEKWEEERNNLENNLNNANKALEKAFDLEQEIHALKKQLSISKVNLKKLNEESNILRESLFNKSTELESALSQKAEYENARSNLVIEIEYLKDEVNRLSMGKNAPLGFRPNGSTRFISNTKQFATSPSKLYTKRQNISPGSNKENNYFEGKLLYGQKTDHKQRPASILFPLSPPKKQNMLNNEMPKTSYASIKDINHEFVYIIKNNDVLNNEIMVEVIKNLKIPQPSIQNSLPRKEILFPAYLINFITFKMWKYGLIKESEDFLTNVMQTIQQVVVEHDEKDVIDFDMFWLSNVHEVLSFISIAENDILYRITIEMTDTEWEEYNRLISLIKHDLENLEFNIYHTWMKEVKKRLHKMIVPAIIESQSLPGFITTDGNKFFNKLLQGTNNPQFTMDDLLSLFNRVYRATKSYYLEHSIHKQAINELLKLVGVTAFNDLLMRRNFLSWKRGLQIHYNACRIEEWCKNHDLPEGILQLEHLMQVTKLLQLKKSTIEDIGIIFDVCWILTPVQIQKLINQYSVADYEHPISSEILKVIANKVVEDQHSNTFFLEAISLDESSIYEIPEIRELSRPQIYLPSWLNVPNVQKLAELSTCDIDTTALSMS